VTVSASRATFAQVFVRAGVFCYRNAVGAAMRVLGTSHRVIEALVARIMSFNNGGLIDFLRPITVKELE
jgi:hypothetical protein